MDNMELKQYAFVRDGIVDNVEKRTQDPRVKLEDLYHPDLLPMFVEIPYLQWDYVNKGWLYDPENWFRSPEQEYMNEMEKIIAL